MELTRLSSKGQVIIPKAVRAAHHWEPGQELEVIDTKEGVLLKPKSPFARTEFSEVFGMLKGRISPKTDAEIEAALRKDIRRKWLGRD